MSDMVNQLRADAEHFRLHGGDRKSYAKCLMQAANHIAELEAAIGWYASQFAMPSKEYVLAELIGKGVSDES